MTAQPKAIKPEVTAVGRLLQPADINNYYYKVIAIDAQRKVRTVVNELIYGDEVDFA